MDGSDFLQVLATELRELEERLAVAHEATLQARPWEGPQPGFQSADDRRSLSGGGEPRHDAVALLSEIAGGNLLREELDRLQNSPYYSTEEPCVPSFSSARVALPEDDFDAGVEGLESPPAPAQAPRVRAGGSGSEAFSPVGSGRHSDCEVAEPEGEYVLRGKGKRVCLRWWKLAADMLVSRDHVLRACWDDNGALKFQTSQRTSLRSTSRDEDIVIRSWKIMTEGRRSNSEGIPRSGRRVRVPKRDCHFARIVMHPHARQRMAWIMLAFLFMAFDLFCLTMDQFMVLNTKDRSYVDLAASVYWTLDIGLSFLTGTFVNSQLVLQFWAIARRYLRTWFLFDASLMILQWTTLPDSSGDASPNHANLVRYIKVMKYVRLLRFAKFDRLLTSVLERLNSASAILLLRCCQYLGAILLWVHGSGCAWYAVGMSSEVGWPHQQDAMRNWPVNYLVAIHWAAANLQGNVDVGPGFLAGERAFAVSHILISLVVFALFLSKLTTVMATLEEITGRLNRQAGAAQRYCKQHRISTQLSVRVRKWLEWYQALDARRQLSVEDEEFMQFLSTDLRRALLDESRSPLLLKHEVFHACRECNARFFQRLCCDTLTPGVMMPEETIFSYGMVCTRMYLIAAGEGSYFKYGAILGALLQSGAVIRGQADKEASKVKEQQKVSRSQLLHEGAALCEAVLWIHWVHLGDFASVTYVSMLLLEAVKFEELVTTYPTLRQALQSHARNFVSAIKVAEDASDLFDTSGALQFVYNVQRRHRRQYSF